MSPSSHILIVEDEGHLAKGIKYNLEAEGYRVTAVGDGPTALRFVEKHPEVDLIILDLMLPGMSGYELCRYCMWEKNLDKAKTAEWKAFLMSLKPDEDLKNRVSTFRFSDHRNLSENAREVILAGLKTKKENADGRNIQTPETQPEKVDKTPSATQQN